MSSVAIIALFCGFITAVSWGVCDYWAARASRSVGSVTSVIITNCIGLLGFTLFYLLTGRDESWTAQGLWYATGAGAGIAGGLIFLYKGLSIGPVSIVSPLSSAYPLIVTAVMIMLFGADVTPRQLIGILTVMAGIMLASEIATSKTGKQRIGRGPIFALCAALSWGIGYALLSQALESTGWQTATLVQLAAVAVTSTILAPTIRGDEKLFDGGIIKILRNPYIIGIGFAQTFGAVMLNVGFDRSANLIPAITAVSACYPVLTILLALKHFKEDFRLIPLGGALLTIAGVILLSLG